MSRVHELQDENLPDVDGNTGIVIQAIQFRYRDMLLGTVISSTNSGDQEWQALRENWGFATHSVDLRHFVFQDSANGYLQQLRDVSARGCIPGRMFRHQSDALADFHHTAMEERSIRYKKLVTGQPHDGKQFLNTLLLHGIREGQNHIKQSCIGVELLKEPLHFIDRESSNVCGWREYMVQAKESCWLVTTSMEVKRKLSQRLNISAQDILKHRYLDVDQSSWSL
jgi:hypothetical protein